MPGIAESVVEVWIAELHECVARSDSLAIRLLQPRVAVTRSGIVCSRLRTICVPERLLTVPDEARRYVLAHELGHMHLWHYPLTMAGVVSVLLLLIFPEITWGARLALLLLSCVVIVLQFIARTEIAADAFAAELLGPENALAGMLALQNATGAVSNGQRRRRIAALLASQRSSLK